MSHFTTTGQPYTIPALKTWSAGPHGCTFGTHSRLVLLTAQLAETGAVFAEDLKLLTGLAIPLVHNASAQAGDIVLTLRPTDAELGEQGYQLEVSAHVTISANSATGVFYGTRTLLQLLAQDFTLNGGVARDWPDYPQRSLM
ncbi:MAG: glycoside hydrolase family 20 zincin-like fold domain-containing protein, partial [Ktedonobacteraceae bacterium]